MTPEGTTADVPGLADVEASFGRPLDEVMSTQRAIRRLLPDDVDDEIVLRCIELGLKAPTGGNGQTWEFVVVKDHETKERLARRYRQAWKLYRRSASRGPDEDGAIQRMLAAVEWQVEHFAEIPVLVVCCLRGGRLPFLPSIPMAEASYYGSIFPSVQNILLAARAVGLGASLITLPLWSTTSARHTLGLPIRVHPVCMIPMGWPRGRYGPTTRKPVQEVVHLDRYGHRPWV